MAPPGTGKVLHAFALAECLTDHVARPLYEAVAVPGLGFEDFVSALRYSDIYEPRNSEWNIAESARSELDGLALLSKEESKRIHALLLDAARVGDIGKAGWETPHYLFTDAGLAYHEAGIGDVEAALVHYSNCARGEYRGKQWLGAKFAERQERARIIPEGAIETLFLRAMVWFRTGRRSQAMPMLRRVAKSDKIQREIAISLHITANDDARKQRYDEAEAAYVRSMEIGKAINHDHHVAQTEHSLANMYARQQRYDEAEAAYVRSIEIDRELNNQFGVAKTEHSLANMYARQQRYDEAEAAYARSIEIGKTINHDHHVVQTEHSLANMYARQQRYDEAEAIYLRSTKSLRTIGDRGGIAQVLHSHAQMLRQLDPERAMKLLQESLSLDKAIGNRRGIEIVQRTITNLERQISAQAQSGESEHGAAVATPNQLDLD